MTEIGSVKVTPRRLSYAPFGDDEARALGAAALGVLATRGVRVAGAAALDALEAAGATVDRAAGTARLPESLVRGAVDRAPAAFTLCGRVPERDVTLGGEGCLLATAAAADMIVDALDAAGAARPATARDVIDAARLGDALPDVAAVFAPPACGEGAAPACGCPPAVEACLTGTTKHVILGELAGAATARAVADAAAAIAGSAGEARRRPPLSLLWKSVPARRDLGEALDAVLTLAAAGLPVGFVLPLADGADAGAPADVAAAVTAVTAAALAAGALVQLVAPGAPFVAPVLPGVLAALAPGAETRPAAYLAVPSAVAVLGTFHLPAATGFAAAGAAAPGWASAVDDLFAGLSAALSRTALLCGAGLLDEGRGFAPEQLLLDVETFANTAFVGAGIVVDDETIAFDTIAAVGIGGNALGQRHTRRHMKDVWRPRLFDRGTHEAWLREGGLGARQRARQLAAELLATHEVPPPAPEVQTTLRRIVEKAGL